MRRLVVVAVFAVGLVALGSACGPSSVEPVVEIAVRQVPDAGGADFPGARDAFVAQLRKQPGVVADHEFQGIFDFSTMGPPNPAVFTGMTQYESLDAYKAASAKLGTSAEAGAFFKTFNPLLFTVLKPLKAGTPVNLAGLAKAGQVVEVASRDLSKYSNFDPVAFASARDAFIEKLVAQPGVVAEYQWVSALDPNIVVGMTVYESAAAFQQVGMSAVATGPEAQAFFKYPAAVGVVHSFVR